MRFVCWIVLLGLGFGASAQVPHVNWENHPVHPIDLSPDGRILAVAHTADARVQFFDVSNGLPSPAGHVRVGLDPVSVRFRSNSELWVVNHLSDSISIVNLDSRTVTATLHTADEPFDVVFAGSPQRAWVSASQANLIQRFSVTNTAAAPVDIPIQGEDPRALAVSNDGLTVYAAVFESGNVSTILAGAPPSTGSPRDVVSLSESPYGGANPPPNDGAGFTPALSPELPPPPPVAQIVRRSSNGRWLDGNQRDWTAFISGNAAAQSGRIPGWDLPDRDLAIIATGDLSVRYASGLGTTLMSVAVNPVSDRIAVVGTEARNEVRFEPNLTGVFAVVQMARVDPGSLATTLIDLNPHLDYGEESIPQVERNRSLGDPRGIVWRSDGSLGYVAGMGSNNVVVIDANGRVQGTEPIEVGEGPVGLALSGDETLLYVWNHFENSLSVVDLAGASEIQRVSAFNPLPVAIREGRRQLYGTHETSGLGHLSCASCHVDARTDRLAWDLGDPSGELKAFNQNCSTLAAGQCTDFHPMKGPMLTQTLQDIIGHEPFHWRGDRDGLEEFNGAFEGLMGAEQLTDDQMQAFEDHLATIVIPPNPFRELDNSLSTSVDLTGHFTTDRFGTAGRPLGTGDARRGMARFNGGRLSTLDQFNAQVNCTNCHGFPTGMGINGTVRDPFANLGIGGSVLPDGPNGENHLSVVSFSTVQEITMKVPQLRTLYERTGFRLDAIDSRAGFGFLHDGTVASLSDFLGLEEFALTSDQDVADVVAFLLSFSGSDLPLENLGLTVDTPPGQDSHAAVGQQVALSGSGNDRFDTFLAVAGAGVVDLVAHQAVDGRTRGWHYQADTERFAPDDGGMALTANQLCQRGTTATPVTATVVPAGLGVRFGLDRDGDGVFDQVEFEQGSDPADAASVTFAPISGLWFNPARSGHGIDLQRAGGLLAGTWYTYNDDGSPTWYQAVGPYQATQWSADLLRYQANPDGPGAQGELVGTMSFDFQNARQGDFCWTLAERSGCEPFEQFQFASDLPAGDRTGLWFDPTEAGYGLSIDSQGEVRVVVVYFYDAQNQPRWVLGQGSNSPSNEIAMLSFNGFCPDCDTIVPPSQEAGQVGLDFATSERTVGLELAVFHPGLPNSTWDRTGVTLVPLTNPRIDYGL